MGIEFYYALLLSLFALIVIFTLARKRKKRKKFQPRFEVVKYPVSFVFVLLLTDVALLALKAPTYLLKWNNTVMVFLVALVMMYLAEILALMLRKSKKHNITQHSLINAKRFIWVIILVVLGLVLLYIWNISIFEFVKGTATLIVENKLLNALSVFIAFLLLANTVLYMFKTYLTTIVRKGESPYLNLVVEKIEYPVSWVIILLGVIVSVNQLDMGEKFILPTVKTAIVIVIMHALNVVIENIIEYWEQRLKNVSQARIDESLFVIAHNTSKIVIVIIAILFILVIWGLAKELKGVFLSLSVIGVVLGIALRETFSNIISGLSLMLDHTFKANDIIQLDTGEMGTVKKIGLRATKIRTFDNEMLTIPNSMLANTKVFNYTQPDSSYRVTIELGVEYGTDPKKVEKVLLNTLIDKDYVVYPECTEVRFEKMDDFSLNFKLIFFVRDFMESFKIKSQLTSQIYKELRKHKIGIPFPTRTIYNMKNGKGDTKTNKKGS
ncbi:MAG: mechanosensitive ion channel family protein [Nanoarchaeota archaeon]